MNAHIAPAARPAVRFLHHEVHYAVPAKKYRAVAIVRAESVEEAERVFLAEVPEAAMAKIIKVIVPRILL